MSDKASLLIPGCSLNQLRYFTMESIIEVVAPSYKGVDDVSSHTDHTSYEDQLDCYGMKPPHAVEIYQKTAPSYRTNPVFQSLHHIGWHILKQGYIRQ